MTLPCAQAVLAFLDAADLGIAAQQADRHLACERFVVHDEHAELRHGSAASRTTKGAGVRRKPDVGDGASAVGRAEVESARRRRRSAAGGV